MLLLAGVLAVAGCTEEPPPRTVTEFLDKPVLLEAAMVRCSQDRSGTRYDAECINAREAVKRLEAKEEAARKVELERQSEAKRRALRRTQEAVRSARRRAAEEERRREEEAYLAQFGVPMPSADGSDNVDLSGNTPGAVIPDADTEEDLADYGETTPASDGGNVPIITSAPIPVEEAAPEPVIEPEPEPEVQAGDLGSIRDELKRRNEDGS